MARRRSPAASAPRSSEFRFEIPVRVNRRVYRVPVNRQTALPLAVALVVALAILWYQGRQRPPAPEPAPAPGPGSAPAPRSGLAPGVSAPASPEGYLLTVWNVENLYDDVNDPRDNDEMENWFGANPAMVARKLDLLAEHILRFNDGLGPDILALVEVENLRAVELLRDRLNRDLPPEWRLLNIVHRDNLSGRRIEPAILTRLPVRHDRTRDFGPTRRMLLGVVEIDGHPLRLLVGHWTSRVTDQTGEKRAEYARVARQAFLSARREDPAVDMILCGDFNDHPDDPSLVRVLGAGPEPPPSPDDTRLVNLMFRLGPDSPAGRGTYVYRGEWTVLDHVVASPGLFDDRGWTVLPDTLLAGWGGDAPPRSFGRPGSNPRRGPSDHLPVGVRLRVRSEPPPRADASAR